MSGRGPRVDVCRVTVCAHVCVTARAWGGCLS